MTTANTPVAASKPATTATTTPDRWLVGAFLLAGAAQLITISALVSADPAPKTWPALLLATAPAPLTALTAFTLASVARPAAVVATVVLIAGIAGTITHTGLFFVPALALLVVGGMRLWRRSV
jgi:hypothetical protein